MSRWSLLWAFVRYRRRQVLVFVALMATLAAAFSVAVVIRSSVYAAEEQSVLASNAHRAYVLQVVDPRAAPRVAKVPGVSPVLEQSAVASTASGQLGVALRAVNDPSLPLELLTSGRRAANASEITLSRAAAEGLAVREGARVTVGSTETTVTGLTIDPADRLGLTAVTVNPSLPVEQTNLWLLDENPFVMKELSADLENGFIKGRTVHLLAQDVARRETAALLPRSSYLGVGLGTVAFALTAALVMALRGAATRTVDALEAAGMPRQASWGCSTDSRRYSPFSAQRSARPWAWPRSGSAKAGSRSC